MRLSRRDLLRSALATGVVSLCPRWVDAAGAINDPGTFDRYLVLVELDGGNDALNTFVPASQSVYYQRRQERSAAVGANNGTKLGIPSSLLRSTPGAHGSFDATIRMNWNLVDGDDGNGRFRRLAQNGSLAVVLGLGTDNPNRSHFRGIDIWNTGTSSQVVATTGWLQRSLMGAPTRLDEARADAIILSRPTSNPLVGGGMRVLSMSNADRFIRESQGIGNPAITGTDALRHVLTIQKQVYDARTHFEAAFNWQSGSSTLTLPTFAGDSGSALFPASNFGEQCRYAAQLIAAGIDVPIIKLRIGGFDTHSTQFDKHSDLLAQLAHGLTGLHDALVGKGKMDQVLIMTYSEFGRRIQGNNSGGTDHGTAGHHVVIGSPNSINAQVFGSYPSLGDPAVNIWNDPLLDRGDMIKTMDYRHLYASGLNFLGLPQNVFASAFAPVTGLLKA